jgi:hypothetical protein
MKRRGFRNGKIVAIMHAGVVFGYLLFVSVITVKYQQHLNLTQNFYFYIIFVQFVYIPVGFLLGSKNIIHFWRKQGKFRWKKSHGLIIFLSLYFLTVPYLIPVASVFPYSMITNPSVSPVVQVILGYFLVTSFYRE